LNYIEEYHFSAGIIRVLEKDILYVKFHNEHVIGVDILKEYQAIRKKIQNGRPYFLMGDFREGFIQFTHNAKVYTAQNKEGNVARQHQALLVSGLAQQLEAQLYVKLMRPPAHNKIFTDFNKAFNWLKSKKIEHEDLKEKVS
jgi:predicted RNA-binding protein